MFKDLTEHIVVWWTLKEIINWLNMHLHHCWPAKGFCEFCMDLCNWWTTNWLALLRELWKCWICTYCDYLGCQMQGKLQNCYELECSNNLLEFHIFISYGLLKSRFLFFFSFPLPSIRLLPEAIQNILLYTLTIKISIFIIVPCLLKIIYLYFKKWTWMICWGV